MPLYFQNPHVSEPLEVSQARKDILMGRRIKQEMNDIECQLLIDCLLRTTTSAEKVMYFWYVYESNSFNMMIFLNLK